ncbi:Telomere length regulation protein elg1 [Tolypocladium paradoxum]|uniref:Telomere length regulation protein elg1 n=1 Tax=Tolypocladium paradoxum TaxID=94208 RepID=A0A2S4KTA4_9HYPO|nr:Telomere length regulation protein elg1 [Tolypocladium paradoxum]
MGPVLVATMVHGGVGEPSSEKLHPFFVKATGNDLRSTPCATDAGGTTAQSPRLDSGDEDRGKKRRKTDSSLVQDGAEARKPRQKRRNGGACGSPIGGGILSHLTRPQPNPLQAESTAMAQPIGKFPTPPLSDTPAQQPVQPLGSGKAVESGGDHEHPQTTPSTTKKVLQFNPKTGTLGSPPKPKQKKSPSLMVCIRYGRDEQNRKDIGDKVTQILDGKLQIPSTPTKRRGIRTSAKPNDSSVNQSVAPKTTHPFFASKGKSQPSEQSELIDISKKSPAPKHSVFMSTPVSPRKPRNPFASMDTSKVPQVGTKPSGTKIPGAMYPMWPPAGMAHVRGEDLGSISVGKADSGTSLSRKSKGHVTTITPKESILTHLVTRLDLNTVRGCLPKDEDTFTPPPAELRLPLRRFESGLKLQKRIKPQLGASSLAALTNVDDSSQDELAAAPRPKIHPAISHHYDSLVTRLSAHDMSSCESLSWTQKYAPTAAAQVLQRGKEAVLLKQWLEAMKVQSVETGGDASGDKGKAKSDGAPKKKRRKNKLDGFVVDSDEEASEMDELSDEDDENLAGMSLVKKSVIRGGDVAGRGSKEQGRLKNTIILSGPHGCGKTAAVYAVAKELDFEVFEINSSSRRSGKDILEKVGDMTRNHLVQQHRAQPASAEGDDGDEVDRDIKSGKQGMMTTFFKPKPATGGKRQTKKQPKEKTDKAPKGSPPKSQKQSLILLEEVDVLYEEDKQFWATLVGMMVQSKRPFVVTCNDEDLIPIQGLILHGILRFSPPPASLAVDLCLLIAANEGHALGRAAVESLYRSRGDDLRATITELNYWCQIGVGDRRGGFDWFYLRWPKGSDLDENGDVVRVIRYGVDWRDMIATTPETLSMEEEVLHQAWDSWRLDMGDWYDSLNLEAPASAVFQTSSRPTDRVQALAAYDEFCGAMSEADICSSGAFDTMLREHIDPTLPDLPSSVRDDFTIGRTLLEADHVAPSTSPHAAISMSMKSVVRQIWHNYAAGLKEFADSSALNAVDEGKAISILDASFQTHRHQLSRLDVARAFDALAISPKAQPTSHLDPSVFDRTMKLIVLDVAPWVRGIVAYEHQLMQERLKLSNLLSEGGKKKRMRTTRSAYSALEGGERRTTRKERYFGNCLSTGVVMRTGAESFQDAVPEKAQEGDPEDSVRSSPLSVESS